MKAKYAMVVDWVKEQITTNNLKKGDKFYNEGELASMFDISRQTVRHAVGLLEAENVLERIQGKGTFVSSGLNTNGKRKTIGVVLTIIDRYIFTAIIQGIEEIIQRNGYAMHLAFSGNEIDGEYNALSLIIDSEVEGIILGPAKSNIYNPYSRIYDEIKELGIPLVFLDAYHEGTDFPNVSMDDVAAGRIATEYLIQAGHTKIAGFFISDTIQGKLRFQGYVDALLSASIKFVPKHTLWYAKEDEDEMFGDLESKRVLERLEGCSALLCFNDRLAFHMVDQLTKAGLRVPEDISVIGIDNSDMATLCQVPLTTFAHPKEELGKLAAENLIQLIHDPAFDARTLVQPTLVERNSVKRLI